MTSIKILDKEFEIYLSEEKIKERILSLAQKINIDLIDKNPLFICVLNGSFIFASDLFREINFPSQITFIKTSSYNGTKSSGKINQIIGLTENIEGRNIVLIEDIIDTGLTIKFLLDELSLKKPASIKIATLLLKRDTLKFDIKPDYIGFEVSNTFLVGYGLDYDGYGRNLKQIYAERKS